MFAKLYETEVGQVLVKLDQNDEYKPEIRYYFAPPNLGVCSIAVSFGDGDGDDGWDNAEKAFSEVTQEKATEVAVGTMRNIPTDI